MKKIFFLLITFIAFISFTKAQNVPREMVSVEDATGTWCTYCPGAAMGCDDLLSNGKYVAVIANHNGDPFANAYSNARNTMYGVSAYPSVGFDATRGFVGGSHTQSMYNNYLPIYTQLIAVTSPVTISMEVSNDGLSYTVIVTLTKVGDITSVNNVLYFFVTQSNITYNWQGQTHLEHVNRLMVPSQNGTPVDFSSGDIQTVTLNFDMNSDWPIEDCEFITFLQNKDTGQGNQQGTSPYPLKKYVVYQTIKRGTIDLTAGFTASDTVVTTNVPVTFTNETYGGYIGVPETTYEWLFPGANPSTSVEKDPTIVYVLDGEYDVTLIATRGGQVDTLTKTAYIKSSFPAGIQEKTNFVNAEIYPNPNNGEFTLEFNPVKSVIADLTVTNANGAVLYKENGLNINGKMIKHMTLGKLSPGVYYLTIQNSDSKTVQKLLVK